MHDTGGREPQLGHAQRERLSDLTPDEERSRTRGPSEFRFEPGQQDVFTRALDALNAARVPYVVAGAHALYAYTGAYRPTKDLDVFCEPRHVEAALETLERAGFGCWVEAPHWLAKALDAATRGLVDVIYGMGNGLFRIDRGWYEHGRDGTLAGVPVRYAPPEDLIWHRLFISERHRFDGADILHLILKQSHSLNWRRLLDRTNGHWALLLAYVSFFTYVYPAHSHLVPRWVVEELIGRFSELAGAKPDGEEPATRGTLLSLFSFEVDTNEWGFRDLRRERIAEALEDPKIRPILESRFRRAAPAPPADREGE